MATAHNAERASKSADLKVVKMELSEEDIRNAALDRLREIQRECEKTLPASTVFLSDIAEIVGVSASVHVQNRAKAIGVKTYMKRKGDRHNKPALCVSEEDAGKLIRSYYENA